MSDPGSSSFDSQPFCYKITVFENDDTRINDKKLIKKTDYRPAPASMKRKRETEKFQMHNMDLLQSCKPLSVKIDRVPLQVISKLLKKSDHTNRAKRKNRWQKGFVNKARKKTKTEKSNEKSERCSEANKVSTFTQMMQEQSWGCCRTIPLERIRSRSHRKSSTRSRDSTGSGQIQQAIPNDKLSESSTSKIASKETILSHDDELSSIKTKDNDVPKDGPKSQNSDSTFTSQSREKRGSITKEESTLKPQEDDDCVCRRTIPYTRKTSASIALSSPVHHTTQAGGSKNPIDLGKSIQNEHHIFKEGRQKSSKSSKKEKRNSETEKEYTSCSKTQPFIFKNRSKERDKILRSLLNDSKSKICEKLSELEFKVREKTDEAKALEPNVSNETDNDENLEDNNFIWNARTLWKFKRKHKSRRISSSSSSENDTPQKKAKLSIQDLDRSDEKKQLGHNLSHERVKSYPLGIRTLCPPSCTNNEHHSGFSNFLYEKPKEIYLKEGRVVLERLENMASNQYVIRWRKNSIIRIKKEEAEEEKDGNDLVNTLEDPKYYIMYEDGTVSNEVLPQEAMYQIDEIPDFSPIGESCQEYEEIDTYEDELIFNNEVDQSVPLEDSDVQVDLQTDDDTFEGHHDLRNDANLRAINVLLELKEYPKVLLIRLETLVGALESEYSASEIENLEEKYIDFLMNSNFSYDKQSQTFFEVYKRIQAKRAKEREIEIMNLQRHDLSFYTDVHISEIVGMDDTDSRDDFVDEKPLIIALDTEREEPAVEDWAIGEISEISEHIPTSEKSLSSYEKSIDSTSLIDPASSEIATIIPVSSNDIELSQVPPPCGNNDLTSIELVTRSKVAEESKEKPLYITCKFCKVSFKSLHSFTLHKSDCHTKHKKRKPLRCEYCQTQYKCKRTLNLHMEYVHRQGIPVTKQKTKSSTNPTANASSGGSTCASKSKKSAPRAAQINLTCGVCSIEFDSKEILWDHVYKHTERELQNAYIDATKNNKDLELQEKLRRWKQKHKNKEIRNQNKKESNKSIELNKEENPLANKYAQWKDRILYKISSKDGAETTVSTNQRLNEKNAEEIILSSSESEDGRESNKESDYSKKNSSKSRISVIKNTKSVQGKEAVVINKGMTTLCPCHKDDTSTMVNGDMQIEMVLLCEVCQVLFRRRDCFEVHYRVNRLCSVDRSSGRMPKLFCSSCRVILNSLPEMRSHLEKHAEVNRQGHVTFLCNICKVMFFGVGSLFYSHWFNHNKDVNFLASRYSFPKLSIVPITNSKEKADDVGQREEYLFVAEYVCKDCKVPFGSENDLEKHVCVKTSTLPVNDKPKNIQREPSQRPIIRLYCVTCQKVCASKEEYDKHEKVFNHLDISKPQIICVATNSEEKAYICPQCKTVRMTLNELNEHWPFHSPKRQKFVCALCPQVRSSKFEDIKNHCYSRHSFNLVSVCKVCLVSATYKCSECSLYFETNKEWKEHSQMCKLPTSLYTTYQEVPNVAVVSSNNSPLLATPDVPSIVSSVAPLVKSTVKPLAVAAPSTSSGGFLPILPKPNFIQKYLMLGSAQKKKFTNECRDIQSVEVIDIMSESSSRSSGTEVSKETSSVEVTDTTNDIPVSNNNGEHQAASKNCMYDSYTPGNERNEYHRNDVSMSKAVVCYPPEKNSEEKEGMVMQNEDSNLLDSTTNSEKKNCENIGKKNLAMTAVNPEFEALLTELEDLENDKVLSKKNPNNLREVRKNTINKESNPRTKESNFDDKTSNLETSFLNSSSAENPSAVKTSNVEETFILENRSPSVNSETTLSFKSTEKEVPSPLPFEVVLLQEEENVGSPKPGAVCQASVSRVDISSNKLANRSESTANDENVISDQYQSGNSTPTEQSTASIIEEYIEYIMMDESSTNNAEDQAPLPINLEFEVPKQIEKVAPTRLRVRTLAELQEIKIDLCENCGQSFNIRKDFDEHSRANSCSQSRPTDFVQLQDPIEHSQDSVPDPVGTTSEVDYEAELMHNLVRRSSSSQNMELIPPLVPLSIHQFNNTPNTSKANMTPVSPNLVIPDVRRRHSGLPFRSNQSYSNNTGMIAPSSASRFNNSSGHAAPRSGVIQLPERIGGSALQKRPSGAATRIQNVSHLPTSQATNVIQHQGLPQAYVQRQTGRVSQSMGTPNRPSPSYSTGLLPSPVLPASEKCTSLSCETCNNFTAKNLAEFSAHLVMHYMESSTVQSDQMATDNDLRDNCLQSNRANQQVDAVLHKSPNTSGYQTPPINASEIYGGRSVTGGWQSPARYIYSCRLCSFRTETKASIRLHEKNHMAVAAMKQKNFQRLQQQQTIQEAFQVQQQRQLQTQLPPTLSQLIEQQKQSQVIKPNTDTNPDKNGVILYTRVSGNIFQCQLCKRFLFSTQNEFIRHLEMAHKELPKERVTETSDKDTICFVCDYCETPQIFESEANLRKHMNFLHNHVCQICSHRCTSREILQTHLLSHKLDN